MARISGKLTGRALGWDRNAIGTAVKKVPQDGGRVKIGRIVGIVSGLHQTVNEDSGEVQTGLKGSFRGISTLNEMVDTGTKDSAGNAVMQDTGKPITVTAGRCYLPGGMQEMIETALAEAQAGDGNARNTVNFALDLYAKPDTNKAGYSYDGETLVDAATADPLALLLESADTAAKALPAPGNVEPEAEEVVVAEKAPEKAPAKAK